MDILYHARKFKILSYVIYIVQTIIKVIFDI